MWFQTKLRWIVIPLFMAAAVVLFSWLLMLLWNAVIPEVFHLSTISFKESLLLFLIGRLFFGGAFWRTPHSGHHSLWYRRYHNMSPEEREKWEQKIHRAHQHHFHHRRNHGDPYRTENEQHENQ